MNAGFTASWRTRSRRIVLAVLALTLIGATGLIWTGTSTEASSPRYFVSIGDSYASGYRPHGSSGGGSSRDSFVYQLGDMLENSQTNWQIVNFACTGETAYAMAFEAGCRTGAAAVDGPPYPDVSQAIAASNFITAHHTQVGLVTIAAGGNDIVRCLEADGPGPAKECAEREVPNVKLSVGALLSRIREAIGPSVPIVGVSYINVYDADRISRNAVLSRRVQWAMTLFRDYLNPALAEVYSRYSAMFVDTTALAGGYLPDDVKGWLPGYGTVPAAVGKVCALTYYCSDDDPHPNRAGHALIANEVARLVRA